MLLNILYQYFQRNGWWHCRGKYNTDPHSWPCDEQYCYRQVLWGLQVITEHLIVFAPKQWHQALLKHVGMLCSRTCFCLLVTCFRHCSGLSVQAYLKNILKNCFSDVSSEASHHIPMFMLQPFDDVNDLICSKAEIQPQSLADSQIVAATVLRCK